MEENFEDEEHEAKLQAIVDNIRRLNKGSLPEKDLVEA